jgi:Mg2+/Co2+ transporter CorB
MEFFKLRCFPRTTTGQAALVTALYCLLVLIALYAPIDPHATLVLALGSRAAARQAMTTFVQLLFWPIVGLLLLTAVRESFGHLFGKRAG